MSKEIIIETITFQQQISLKETLLALTLEVGVPLVIAQLQRHGGPTEQHLKFARIFARTLGEKGDQLLYRGKETAILANQLIEAVAIAAFQPGGIRLLGLHFEAQEATSR